MRSRRVIRACLIGSAICAAPVAYASSGHAVPRPARAVVSPAVPNLTPGGRFVYGPSFGHPPVLGADAVTRKMRPQRRLTGGSIVTALAPLGVAVPYSCSGSAFPSFAFSGDCREEPAPLPAQAAVAGSAPTVVIVAAPHAPQSATQWERPRAVASEAIYYCAERSAYTNDRTVLRATACADGWRRMTR